MATMRDALLQVRLSCRGALFIFSRKGVIMDQQPHTESEVARGKPCQPNATSKQSAEDSPNLAKIRKHKRIVAIAVSACIVVIIAVVGFFALSPTPKGDWYANGLMKAVTLNNDGTANVGYLKDPDSPNLHSIAIPDSATWEQKGEKVIIHYKEEHKNSSKTDYTVYLIYGKDSDGDEFLKNLETNDVMYRSGSVCESKKLR